MPSANRYVLPGHIASYEIGAPLRCIAISGNHVHAMDSEGSLHLIDISSPAIPVRVGSYNTGINSWGGDVPLAVSGNYAYVAGWPGLQVLNITDPTNPTFVGIYEPWEPEGDESFTHEWFDEVTVLGNYAYVAGSWSDRTGGINRRRLEVLDVSNPTSPVPLGHYDLANFSPHRIALTSDFAFVVEGECDYGTTVCWGVGLHVIDVTNPANPVRIGGYNTGRYAQDVAVSVSGEAGSSVRVQRSSNLVDWTNRQTATVGEDAVEFIDSDATSTDARFYRAITQ